MMLNYTSSISLAQRMRVSAFPWLAVCLAMFFSMQVEASMFGWFKRYDVHLSPDVYGVLTYQGAPLAGVTVYRELDYDRSYTDKAVTDGAGRFVFAARNIRSRLPGKMLDQSTVRQVLSVDHGDRTHVLWYTSTSSLLPHAAFVRELGRLQCELTDPEQHYLLGNDEHPDHPLGVVGICRLDALVVAND